MTLKRAFFLALFFHVGLLIFFLVELRFPHVAAAPSTVVLQKENVPVIEATALNQEQIEKQMARVQEEERQKELEKQQNLEKMQQAASEAKQQQEEAQKQLVQLEQLKQQQALAAQEEQERLKNLKEQQVKEQEKLKKLQEAAKEQKEKEEQERKVKLAEAQKEKLAKELEEKKKLAAAAAAVAQEKKKRQEEADRLLQQQLAKEHQQLMAAKQQEINNELLRYTLLIKQSISQHWNVPETASPNLFCVLFIRLSDRGQVLTVQLVKSSGDPLLDRSAEAAVYKASPLPVSNNPEIMEKLREIRLTVNPSTAFNRSA